MLQKLGFLPGFNKQVTETGAEAQWTGVENATTVFPALNLLIIPKICYSYKKDFYATKNRIFTRI